MATRNKTNRSLQKRFKVTATKKLKHQKCNKRHLNAHMTGKRKRQLDRPGIQSGPIVDRYLIAMGE